MGVAFLPIQIKCHETNTRREMKKCLLIFQMMISSNKTHLLQDEMSEVECMDNKHRQNEYSETLE